MADSTSALIVADPSKGIKVNAAIVAKPFRDEIKEKVKALKAHGIGKMMMMMLPRPSNEVKYFYFYFYFRS